VSVTTYVFGIVSALLVLVVVFELLRRRRVRERHALWWMVAGTLALLIAVFPHVLTGLAGLLGIAVPTNLGFFVCVVVLFLVSVQHSAELTILEEKSRTLAEHVALLDERVSRLDRAADRKASADDVGATGRGVTTSHPEGDATGHEPDAGLRTDEPTDRAGRS